MDRKDFRKILVIALAILIAVGLALCFIGQFGLKDDRYAAGILSKLGVGILFASVIIAGVGARIFQIKDVASVAKDAYQEFKKSKSKDDLIDPVSGALKDRSDDFIGVPLDDGEGKRIPKIAWFYIICIGLFLLLPTIGVVMFHMNKFLAGGLLFGFGVLSLVIMIIGNAIIMKRNKYK